MRIFHLTGAFCAAILLSTVCGYGQAVNATLLGTVTDASGAAVSNATVTLTETNTSVTHTGKTNESGNYTFPALPPGSYSVSVEANGFKKEGRSGVDF